MGNSENVVKQSQEIVQSLRLHRGGCGTECVYWGTPKPVSLSDTRHCHRLLCEDAANLIEILQAHQAQSWIPVKERMPEDNRMVLLYTPRDGYICVGFHQKEGHSSMEKEWNIVTSMRSSRKLTKRVTHWMPLPEPPKEMDK